MDIKEFWDYIVIPLLAWNGWMTLQVIQQGKKIAVFEQVKDIVDEIKADLSKTNDRLDLFLKNELDVLKDIAKRE